MSRSTRGDERLPAPPTTFKAQARHHQNVTQSTLMIEPTDERQQFYNKKRREMDRQRLELHVETENVLERPLNAELISRSTTSDGLRSPSTIYSYPGDGHTHLPHDPRTEVIRLKGHRGRRKGPLDLETRTKTAFKRKFKLICGFHRGKKTSCNCHDFSKLEEGYRSYLATEGKGTRDAQDRSASQQDISNRSFGDLGTFGTGGAAQTTPFRHPDSEELNIGDDVLTHVRATHGHLVEFDLNEMASLNGIMSTLTEQPPYSAPARMWDSTRHLIRIGSTSPYYPNRWQCEYNGTNGDTRSVASAESCPWTGPLNQLHVHFNAEHRPLQFDTIVHWSKCGQCGGESQGPTEVPPCRRLKWCPSDSWQQLCFGAAACWPNYNSSTLPVSGATESRSHVLNTLPGLSTPGSSTTEQSNLAYNYTAGNFDYQQQAWWNGRRVEDDASTNASCPLFGFQTTFDST
ncbi:hypothetical protein F4861DRAFT_188818 [Xylaria intraflava]|nr:hypothetical protein F4861DRAFT_188818 [Xylaria intraflava]